MGGVSGKRSVKRRPAGSDAGPRRAGPTAVSGPRGRPAHAVEPGRPVGCAVITVSDTRRGARDLSGNRIQELLERAGHDVITRAWVRDQVAAIRRAARAALGRADVDVVIATGGTGVSPRDRTPEALAPLAAQWLPGFGERFRAHSESQVGSAAWLSRAAAFVARGRLVVLLPGSTPAVELALTRLLLPELGHVTRLIGRRT